MDTPIFTSEIQNYHFLVSSLLKSVTNYGVAWMGLNFYGYHSSQKIKCAYNYDTQCIKFSLTSPSQYLTNKSTPLYNHCAMSYSCLCKSILRLFRPCQMLWHKSFQAKQGGNKKSSKSKVFSSLTWSIKWVETLSEFKFLFSFTVKSRVLTHFYNIEINLKVTVDKHKISPS